jgi:hypothetical protein
MTGKRHVCTAPKKATDRDVGVGEMVGDSEFTEIHDDANSTCGVSASHPVAAIVFTCMLGRCKVVNRGHQWRNHINGSSTPAQRVRLHACGALLA